MGPRMFTGWGIRTLAEGEGRFNPVGYHVGTIWPFDNSFIAWGCDATASSRRQRRSPLASSTPPPSSTVVCRRRSAATSGRRQPIPWSIQPRAAPRPGRRALRCCCCERCSAWSPWAITSSSTPPCRAASACSLYWRSRGAGAASMPSRGGDRPHKEVGSATAARAAQGAPRTGADAGQGSFRSTRGADIARVDPCGRAKMLRRWGSMGSAADSESPESSPVRARSLRGRLISLAVGAVGLCLVWPALLETVMRPSPFCRRSRSDGSSGWSCSRPAASLASGSYSRSP